MQPLFIIVTIFELATALGVSHVRLVEPDGESDEAAKPLRHGGRRKAG